MLYRRRILHAVTVQIRKKSVVRDISRIIHFLLFSFACSITASVSMPIIFINSVVLGVVIGCDSSYFSYMTICSDCKITSSTLFSSKHSQNSLYDISCFFGVCNDSITIFKITVAITEITKNINNGFFSGERFFLLLSINVPPRFSSYLYITNIKMSVNRYCSTFLLLLQC